MAIEDKITFQDLATFTHGALFGLHCLGAYNAVKKKHYLHVAVHTSVAIYDGLSALYHYKKSKQLNNENGSYKKND